MRQQPFLVPTWPRFASEARGEHGLLWAAFVFHSFLGGLKQGRAKGERSWEELMPFYVAKFSRALDFGQ